MSKKTKLGLALLFLLALLSYPIYLGCKAALRKPSPEQVADQPEWIWEPEKADIRYCCEKAFPAPAFHVDIEERPPWHVTVRVSENGQEVYSLSGHSKTVFARRDDMLYIADFIPLCTGCYVSAYNFRTKTEMWRTRLRGVGPVTHSAYWNNVTIATTTGNLLVVTGNEAAGHYIEYLDMATGKCVVHVGHKAFRGVTED